MISSCRKAIKTAEGFIQDNKKHYLEALGRDGELAQLYKTTLNNVKATMEQDKKDMNRYIQELASLK